jgi:uncharacterized membrane protein
MLGKLHPLLVHLPIGFLFLHFVLGFLTRWDRYAAAKIILPISLLLGSLTAALTCITGWFLAQSGDYDNIPLSRHQYLGIAVAVFSFALWLFKKQDSLLAIFVLALLLTAAGHFGGTLTHGENYLFNKSSSQKSLDIVSKDSFGEAGQKPKPNIENIQKARVYNDLVEPILKQNCYACHSAAKQKGKLRLDEPAAILRGGENGATIIAGNADESLLIKRLLLDLNHDDHMPPKGKPQPSADDITLLKWWITEGGHFDKRVEDLEQTAEITPLLARYQNGTTLNMPIDNAFLPIGNVASAPESLLDSLRKAGITLVSILPNSPFLSVSFIGKPDATDKDIAALKPIASQIAWLKLSGTAITDAALETVGQMPHLTRLFLNDTPISDSGLGHLAFLRQLHYLNLVGTRISVKALRPFSSKGRPFVPLPPKESFGLDSTVAPLQYLFLFNTGITPKDSAQLRSLLPRTHIDFGGYQVPTFAPDTTVLKKKK